MDWVVHPGFAAAVLGLFLVPYAVLGQDIPIPVHDNLDSVFVWPNLLVDSGLVFARGTAIVPAMMGGLPRDSFGSELSVLLWLHAVASPFAAYALNQVFMHAAGLVGMWLLVRRHIAPGPDTGDRLITAGVALSFSLLPFWPGGGLSVAGLPLALHAFLNVRKDGGRLADHGILLLLPLYSSAILSFAFFLALMGAVALRDAIVGRPSGRLFAAVGAMALVYGLVEYRTIGTMLLGAAFQSHRLEFSSGGDLGWIQGGRLAVGNFLSGHYHAPSLHTFVVLPTVLAALAVGRFRSRPARLLWLLLAVIAGISALVGVLQLDAIDPLRARFAVLRTFNFARADWLHPLLWYCASALALTILKARFPRAIGVLAVLVALQVGVVATGSQRVQSPGDREIPYRAFYAAALFDDIKAFIGVPTSTYRVVSLGMHPAVALHNGLQTLDGYSPNYPLPYKHAFRRIIAPDLARDRVDRAYFDGWGSRAYVLSAELHRCKFLCTKEIPVRVRDLRVDATALHEMGGRFVLSAVPIEHPERHGLRSLRTFDSGAAVWRVHLYAVSPPSPHELWDTGPPFRR